jgi:hypothetical protein
MTYVKDLQSHLARVSSGQGVTPTRLSLLFSRKHFPRTGGEICPGGIFNKTAGLLTEIIFSEKCPMSSNRNYLQTG